MREYLEYVVLWTYLKFLGLLPRSVARWTAARVFAIVFPLHPAWRRVALFNLRLAFPDWSEAQRLRTMHLMVRNLGWIVAEFAHFPDRTPENISSAITLEGFDNFLAAERRGKGVLLLTGHMGVWELKPVAMALYYRPIHFLVRPIDNPRVDALVNRYRRLCGSGPIPKNASARAVLRVLRAGGVVGILADQNTAPEEGLFVDFFGVPASTTTGVARMARHTGAAIIPVYTFWDAPHQTYRLRYEPELPVDRTNDPEADVRSTTARCNLALESYVRRFPDQWLWVHRRWRNRPPGEEPIYPDEKRARVPAPRAAPAVGHDRENQT